MSYFTQVSYSDTGALDAFSRLRTSSPEALFAVQTQYDAEPLQMEAGATGTGVTPAHNANTRLVELSCTAGVGASFFQSYQYHPYQPGRSQFIAMTGVLGTGVANTTVDVGYFDAANGVIFRQNGVTDLQLILRTSTSGSVSDANMASQVDWNIDPMNGLGPSGITFDATKAYILIIDLQFLGMGRVRVGFDIDGVIYYVHQFFTANVLSVAYMQSATLPVQMLVTATGSAAPKSAHFKCATVQSEGGSQVGTGYNFATPEGTLTAGVALQHVLSVRPRTTFNSIPNRSLFHPEGLNIYVEGANDLRWQVGIGATFSVAPTFANINATHSAFEYGTGGTLTALPIIIASGFANKNSVGGNGVVVPLFEFGGLNYPISLNRAGAVHANGTLSVAVQTLSGNSAMRASMLYREVR